MCLKESAQLVISGRGGGATEQTERVSEESRWTDERDGATKKEGRGRGRKGRMCLRIPSRVTVNTLSSMRNTHTKHTDVHAAGGYKEDRG